MYVREYLPSGKFTKIVGSVLLVILLILVGRYAFRHYKNKTTTYSTATTTQNKTFAQAIEKDTDGDTIPDWQEVLWGTNPQKTSTFDGKPDTQYIADKKAQEIQDPNTDDTKKTSETNQTEVFAKQLFASIVALQQSGNLNEASANQLIDSLVTNAQKNTQRKVYTEKDLTISSKTTRETFQKAVRAVLVKHKVYKTNNDIILKTIETASASEDSSTIQPIATIGESYAQAIQELLTIPTPTTATNKYLAFINAFQYNQENIEDMSQYFENPIASFSAVYKYADTAGEFITQSQTLGNYFVTGK